MPERIPAMGGLQERLSDLQARTAGHTNSDPDPDGLFRSKQILLGQDRGPFTAMNYTDFKLELLPVPGHITE